MKKLALFFILAVSALSMAGCATATQSGGNTSLNESSNLALRSELVKGKTTESQVKKLFGAPYYSTFTSNGNLEWTFINSQAHSTPVGIPIVGWFFKKNVKVQNKTLVVLFSRNRVVKNWDYNDQHTKTTLGLSGVHTEYK